ncbi:discoidin domain-containing protein [Streptomyces sp. NBC_01244]|uniref:discoidin domain-containing protein n=1 Tax=Streptomyces sp. NBC_01244 TaxID=2903797 RepID=UPI002E11D19F|nr:discoidin domain-containing protein [Streptomyces sp. NBC_01244]
MNTTWRARLSQFLVVGVVVAGLAPAAGAAQSAEVNSAPPGVVPALQKWTGGTGRLVLSANSRVVVPAAAPAGLQQVAQQLAADVAEMTTLHPTVVTGTPAAGDISLRVDAAADFGAAKPELKPEAYRLAVGSTVEIVGGSDKGAYYGSRSLVQAVVSSSDHLSLPVGTAVDYPDYAVRGFMLDVGRRFFTPQYIQSTLRWMGWLKMNTLQIHLNDNGFASKYDNDYSKTPAAFRLKGTNPEFAGLAATDGSYSRTDWDGFESTAAKNAITIIPEIDAPAHSLAFIHFKPELGLNGGNSDHLDLSKPATTAFMKSLFAEFTPWFKGPTVHIGIDEYPSDKTAEYKAYVNTIAPYVRSLGKKVNAWGSFTQMSGGGAGYDKDMVINSWNNDWYSPKAAIADGYKVINSNDALLYVVPFAPYYHGQGLDGGWIFNSWAPNIFGGSNNLPAQDPNLLGGMPAVWNDQTWVDYTELQVHGLIEKSFAALAQKMWSPTAGGTDYSAFLLKVATVGQGPGTSYLPETVMLNRNPSDLAYGRPATASSSETSGLGAANAVDGLDVSRWASSYSDSQWLKVDLGSSKSFNSVRLNWQNAYGKDYDIQTSADGTTWTTVAQRRGLTASGLDTLTFPPATGRYVRMQGITRGTSFGYSLFSFEVISDDLARGRTATASSSETSGLGAANAVDGLDTTRWASSYSDSQWLKVDLGSSKTVKSVRLNWEGAYGKDYDIQTSADGTTWTTVAQRRSRTTAGVDTVTFPAATGRYVRIQGITRGTGYGYSLYSFEVRA